MSGENQYNTLIKTLNSDKLLRYESLSKYTSLHIGGKADLFYKSTTIEELTNIVQQAVKCRVPYLLLGGGTNLLISDKGFRGLVIKNESRTIKFIGIRGNKQVQTVYLEAESGVSVNRLVRYTLDQGLAGLEFFLGQPGSIGGAVYINAHNMWKKKYFSDSIFSIKLMDSLGNVRNMQKSYFKFGYDKSLIQKTKEIVLSVIFELQKKDNKSLWEEAQHVLQYRRKTQPSGVYSAGCIFRNIKKSEAVRIASPNYTCSAGYLIESVGLRGFSIGKAQFSEVHANFIIHQGGARACDVLELINIAKEKVRKKYGIELHEEIVFLGDF